MSKSFSFSTIPAFYIWAVVGVLASYLTRLLFVRSLSIADYGTLYSVIGFFSFLAVFNDLGLGASSLYHFTRLRSKLRSFRKIFSSFARWRMVIGLILSLLLLVSSKFIAEKYFHNPAVAPLLCIISFTFLFEALIGLTTSYFGATGRSGLYASSGQIRLVLFLLFSFFAQLLTPKEKLLQAILFTWVLSYVLVALSYALKVPWKKLLTNSRGGSMRKQLWGYAFFTFLSSTGAVILMRIDVIIITYFRSSTEVGLYEIALPIATMLLLFVDPLMTYLNPMVVDNYSKGNKLALSKTLTVAYNAGVFLLLPFTLLQILYAKEIIIALFGAQYVAAAPALVALALVIFVRAIQAVNFVFLYSSGHIKEQNTIMWQAALINTILNLLFVPYFGFVAAAYCTLIAFIYMLLRSYTLLKQKIHFTISIHNWIKSLSLSVFLLALTFWLKQTVSLTFYVKATALSFFFIGLYFSIGIFVLRIISWSAVQETLIMFMKSLYSKKAR